jgi:hypothetical protein
MEIDKGPMQVYVRRKKHGKGDFAALHSLMNKDV